MKIFASFFTTTFVLLLLFISQKSDAVWENENQVGQYLLIPYYSARNNMNTQLSVSNLNNSQTKLVQVTVREGKRGLNVLTFFIQLSPQDTWTAGIGAIPSMLAGYENELGGAMVSFDESCSTISGLQQFLPYEYEAFEGEPSNIIRTQEGYIDIFELGVMPERLNCDEFETAVNESRIYEHISQLSKGEITAITSILNVDQGTSYSVPIKAFGNVINSEILTLLNSVYYMSLSYIDPVSILKSDGQFFLSHWNTGVEAISALLMAKSQHLDFALDTGNNSQTEVLTVFPTGVFYYLNTTPSTQPFPNDFLKFDPGACVNSNIELVNRIGTENVVHSFDKCQVVSQLKLYTPSGLSQPVFDSQFGASLQTDKQNGKINFDFSNYEMTSLEGHKYKGLPSVSFGVQRYTNANAQPGKLAQYGSLFKSSDQKSIE